VTPLEIKKVNKRLNAKTLAFIALMGALGNILFMISSYIAPIIPGDALDLSHIPTFIAAIYGGPLTGFITGLLVGILPGIQFGPLSPHGSWVALWALPLGKSLTGLTMGLLCRVVRVDERGYKSILTVPLILLSYIPECIFTIVYFVVLLPCLIGSGGMIILMSVLPKAWVEIIFMSFFIAALRGNNGFNSFIQNFVATYKSKSS